VEIGVVSGRWWSGGAGGVGGGHGGRSVSPGCCSSSEPRVHSSCGAGGVERAALASSSPAPAVSGQIEVPLFRLCWMWASTDESHVGFAGKTTTTPSGVVFLLRGVVVVFPTPVDCRGASAVPWWRG